MNPSGTRKPKVGNRSIPAIASNRTIRPLSIAWRGNVRPCMSAIHPAPRNLRHPRLEPFVAALGVKPTDMNEMLKKW